MKTTKYLITLLACVGAILPLQAQSADYTISVVKQQHCTVSIDPQNSGYAEGDAITVTLTPVSGSTFQSFKLYYECSEAEYWQAMSAASRHREQAPRRAADESAFGYRLESYYFSGTFDDAYTTVTEGAVYTFTMPARNVEIEAVCMSDDIEYGITITGSATVEGNKTKEKAGETVTFTATPPEGQGVTSVKVYELVTSGNMTFEDELPYTRSSVNTFSFTMPANPVHIVVKSGSAALGDVNADGQVTIADVAAVVSHLLGHTPAIFNSNSADVDGNAGITLSDALAIVDIILGK